MTPFWPLFLTLLLIAVFCVAVLFRSMLHWTRIVETIDTLPDTRKSALGWPLEPGRAVQNRTLRSRVLWYGAPEGAPEAALAPVRQYRRELLGSYAAFLLVVMVLFAWQVVFFALLAGLSALIVRPWPRLPEGAI